MFNDSESLMWDLALTLEGHQKEMHAKGGMAFILIKLVNGKQERIYFGRNGDRPLIMNRTDESLTLSSEGEGVAIETDVLFNWNFNLKRLTQKAMIFPPIPKYVPVKYEYNYNGYRPPYNSGFHDYEDDDYKFGYIWDDDEQRWLSHDEANELQAVRRAEKIANSTALRDVLAKNFFNRNPLNAISEGPANFFNEDGELDDEDSLVDYFAPENGEVETVSLQYLTKAHGHFEQAYWLAETDYADVCDSLDTADNTRKKFLLEGVLDNISGDPEYENENSVSSIWEALWTKAV